MTEVRLHGRGGQGMVKAAEILAASMLREGVPASCFPLFGSERRGAPVQSFLRYGEKRVRVRNKIYSPDVVVVSDASLAANPAWYKGLSGEGLAIVNSPAKNVTDILPPEAKTLVCVAGNDIAMEVMGRPITNTVMLGAFAGATGVVGLETLKSVLGEYFSGNTLELNRQCAEHGFNEFKTYRRQPDGSFAADERGDGVGA